MRDGASKTQTTGAISWDKPARVDMPLFWNVLEQTIEALDRASIPYLMLGGLASAALGRSRWTRDIDLFVRQEDAPRALRVLAAAGFETQETNPHWLYKAVKHDVLVDILFRAKGDIFLDDEMLARSTPAEIQGHRFRAIPAEDLLVIKAIIHDEETPRHWFDALGLIAARELDWDYLLKRAVNGTRRVLALLVYAQSVDIVVPDSVIARLHEQAYPT